MPEYLHASAHISGCYRYTLSRWWAGATDKHESDPANPHILWVMLNPSTADGETDDATIRRCVNFSQAWGANGMVVVNLFALRATNPAQLRKVEDPVGPRNMNMIQRSLAVDPLYVVCAWGAHPMAKHQDQDRKVFDILKYCKRRAVPIMSLGTTNNRSPRHPLRLAKDTKLVRYTGPGWA